MASGNEVSNESRSNSPPHGVPEFPRGGNRPPHDLFLAESQHGATNGSVLIDDDRPAEVMRGGEDHRPAGGGDSSTGLVVERAAHEVEVKRGKEKEWRALLSDISFTAKAGDTGVCINIGRGEATPRYGYAGGGETIVM